MTQDAFELLQAANPVPEDPPPLPIAPLLDRVDELPLQTSGRPGWPFGAHRARRRDHESGGLGARRPKRGLGLRYAVIALGVVAVTMLALTKSTTVTQRSDSGQTVVAPENETALGNRATPDEFQDLRESSNAPASAAQIERQKAQAAAVDPAAGPNGLSWKQLGPYNIGGRVTDVVADRFTPNAAFTAVSGGGIWKTSDGGASWANLWPDENTQTMGAFAQAPNGDLWAGTGEANPPGGGLTYFGDGVYKSTDDGGHWSKMGLDDSAAIGRIAVDPANSQRLFVAASGHIARTVSDRGLYRTLDGGKTWQLVLAPPNGTTGAIDVAINPANPQIVYASLWDHVRNNGRRFYGGVGSGLFRSNDGGETWKRLENVIDPLPTYDATQSGLKSDASLGRIGMALAPSNPNRLYVVFGNQTGPDKGFYYSDDGGDTLRVGGRAYAASGGYQWWFGRIWVDPDDQNHLFNADVSLRTSINAGTTWTAISGPALRPARDGLGSVDARRQSGDAGQGVPRQRRRHLPLGEQRRQRLVGQGRQPAVEPALPPGDLQAALAAHHDRPAGQRQRQVVDADPARPGRPGAQGELEQLRRRRRSLERDRPDRRHLLLHVLAGLWRRHAQLLRTP